MNLGISGTLTKAFIRSPLAPLILLAAMAVGLMALVALPREEEPQISVPMVDIQLSANGYKAEDAVELLTRPLEDIVKGINGVEHVYSQTQDDRVVVTARFNVGTDEDDAILRVHEKIRAHILGLPKGISEPLIIGRGINDVAILTLTLSPQKNAASHWDDNGLYRVATDLQHELAKTENVGLSYIVGGAPSQIRIQPDPAKLSLYGITLNQLVDKLTNANRSLSVGRLSGNNISTPVIAGQTLQGIPDIGMLLLTTRDGRPVYVRDVATIIVGAAQMDARVATFTNDNGKLTRLPAVTLAFAKRKGANAVTVADDLLSRLAVAQKTILPADIQIETTRNYGATATEKADELLFHLGLATLTIVLLIGFTIGWREATVVAVVIPTTILLTLFAAWIMGYTINRVSLFALIFSIGILVDDAIVVVENIVRHWRMDKMKPRVQAAIEAVAEVGNPTIVATLTIIVALLPMMFVSGLMGPYMSPIPANASMAMVFSFFVAVILTPWLLMKIGTTDHHHDEAAGFLPSLYARIARPLLAGRVRSRIFLLSVGAATLIVCMAFPLKLVTVKLLPFDNKSEVQVVVDLPRGAPMEATDRVLQDVALRLRDLPELVSLQTYAGTSMPFNFNGLVRHYYLRSDPQMGDVQVNLKPKHERSRASHAIALDIRARLAGMPMPAGTALKVVEVPPGPPVMATLLAEIYGPDAKTRRASADAVRAAFNKVDFVTDTDVSYTKPSQRMRVSLNQDNLEHYGVEEQAVYDTLAALIGGVKLGYSQKGDTLPVDITMQLPKSDAFLGEHLLSTPIPAGGTKRVGGNVELGDVVTLTPETESYPIFRRDGRYAEMVTAELAGRFEAPIYGMFAVKDALTAAKTPIEVTYHGQPLDESKPTLLWDGEWEVTYVTFRDMGAAFGVAILGIYLLVVAQFRSFLLPLVILVPVPLTLIGIVLGHALLGAAFTATSMIGFIALAGIIVRNSILLVDFIRHLRMDKTVTLRNALVQAGIIRIRPIVLTAAAAMIGAAFILTDPIFQGLAISMVFGLASSTALTLLVIPAIYIWFRDDGKGA